LLGHLDLVSELIDAEGQDVSICITPLLFFLKAHGVKTTIEKILENPTKNDWISLLKLNEQLEDLQLQVLRKEFLSEVMLYNDMQIKESLWLGLKAIYIFDKELGYNYLTKIDNSTTFINEDVDLIDAFGNYEYKIGCYEKAVKYFEKSLSIRLINLGLEHMEVAENYEAIGVSLVYLGKNKEALKLIEKSLKIRLKTFGENHYKVADSYSNIGFVYNATDNYDKSLQFNEKSLSIRLKYLGSEHLDVANSLNNIGSDLANKYEFDKAIECYKKCISIQLNILGEEHSIVALSYFSIGEILFQKGELNNGIQYIEKCLTIRLKYYGKEHIEVAEVYESLGSKYYEIGENDKSIKCFDESLEIRINIFNQNQNLATSQLTKSFQGILIACFKINDIEKALEILQKQLTIIIKNIGKNNIDVSSIYFYFGLAYEQKGDKKNAYYNYIVSCEIIKDIYGYEHHDTQEAIANAKRIAKELNKEGDLPEWMF
jgi:tetratricopeptide (TPR) repeat protein